MAPTERLGGTPLDLADPKHRVCWQAQWLHDPIFKNTVYQPIVAVNRTDENRSTIQNRHTLFRREFQLPGNELLQAKLYITADDTYKLYVNGHFIGVGPALSYPFDYHYNGWDVTEFLRADALNCLGVHTYYQGLHNMAFISGDNLQGLLLQLELTYTDGSSKILISDETWRCFAMDAFESRQLYGYQTAFSEHIDLRRYPVNWNQAGFDDHVWQMPHLDDTPIPEIYQLTPQLTPPVTYFKTYPVQITYKENGHYFIDFGIEVVGETVFTVSGASGQIVEIRHGEELDGPDTVRHNMRCNCNYQEFCTLSGRKNEQLEFFDFKGFRYVEVLGWPEDLTANNVWVKQRHYPFPKNAGTFSSSDLLLNDIWRICANGVRVGTLDTYMDCPTREKGGFVGDGFITGMSHLILTGDSRILRKFLLDVANSARVCPGFLCVAPTYVSSELAEYSMLWPILLEYYYHWTGDLEFVRQMQPPLDGLLAYYAGYENEDGLLQDVIGRVSRSYAVLVDWPVNFRDDYDDPLLTMNTDPKPSGVINTMINAFYFGMLSSAARLNTITGRPELCATLTQKAEELRTVFMRQCFNKKSGLFVDRPDSNHSALHANVIPLFTGLVPPEKQPKILDFLRQTRISCGVYFAFFLLQSLFERGESDLAYDLITSHDRNSWFSMLKAGTTTCMEAWDPDLKPNTSWCHPWSSAPIPMLTHELFGLRPAAPGWKTIAFSPKVPLTLKQAELRFQTPAGALSVSFEWQGNEILYRLEIPAHSNLS
ncbi:family 78 glycoside hydrolase catalytic domain, partial [bacterium]|nr:family 78 glycoside hydrolase catalytic domain [bacterium]